MTKALPFTAAGLARAIKGAEKAGKNVAGVRPDGTLIFGDNLPGYPSVSPVPVQADPYAIAAKRVGYATTKRKRNRATS